MSKDGGIPAETLLDLRRRLDDLALRDSGRRVLIEGVASLFDFSRATVYRALSGQMVLNLYRPSKLQCFGKINRFLDETT